MQDDYFCHAHNQNGLVGIVFVDKCVPGQVIPPLVVAGFSCLELHALLGGRTCKWLCFLRARMAVCIAVHMMSPCV